MLIKLDDFKSLFASYKRWVAENPQLVSDVETTAKWVSYFVAGRVSNSNIVSELIYSLSNILVLFNDRIIEKAHSVVLKRDAADRVKLFLTTLEYCEVFIELSSRRLWGEKGKWRLIVLVQLVKAVARYMLLNKYSVEIIRAPTIQALDRKKLSELECNKGVGEGYVSDQNAYCIKLKRSGRVIRKIEGAPPIQIRDWQPLDTKSKSSVWSNRELFKAECIYIMKPLIHLGGVRLFGYKSIKTYGLALMCDLMSIRIYYNNRHLLTKQQRLELSRRCVNLLLYFMRSPVYERTTKKKLTSFLNSLANNIPLARIICNPLIQYIPHWQSTYFYMWST